MICVVHVIGAVHHDRAVARVVVEPRLEAVEVEGDPVLAVVGVRRAEDAQARHAAAELVGEALGHVLSAAAAVRDALGELHAPRRNVDDEEARLRRGPRVVDHGEDFRAAHGSGRHGVAPGREPRLERRMGLPGHLNPESLQGGRRRRRRGEGASRLATSRRARGMVRARPQNNPGTGTFPPLTYPSASP